MTRDLVCAAVLLCVAVAYYVLATGISRSALADEVGAHGLPVVYAVLLASIAVALGAKAGLELWLARRRRPSPAAAASGPAVTTILKRAAGVLAIGIAYLLIVPYAGYLIAIGLAIAAMLMYQGERPDLKVAVTAIAGATGFWLLFDRFLGIDMPSPPFL